ncbi:unnamed protein product [Nyctereutes procyonoides]|uniref:40S ribosomal protein S8 n=1 Tax=Nyctereutes procyonoides TaxID=34880 RepID=A0A811ZL65_NYCPR|nr:unnamed protein product [Nyctereutes procyonoides]
MHQRRERWASLGTTDTSAPRPGGKSKPYHKKQKHELGRPVANTKIGPHHIHTIQVWGGNKKYRALRLDVGNFSWGSECCTHKTRIIDVVYNASDNELVCTKTLVKNCISHYALPLGCRKGKIQKYDERKKNSKISSLLEEQFQQGKLLADGYVLEGKELEFYLREIKARKGK